MKSKTEETVNHALDLDGKPESVKSYYADWADTYDEDLDGFYVGPGVIVDILNRLRESGEVSLAAAEQLVVADVGCGTGLIAKELVKAGFRTIDGCDLSPEMVEVAKTTGLYRRLQANFDLNLPPPSSWADAYDILICCGVFTTGHVPPSRLYHLFDMMRPGGIVLTSTRISYYESSLYGEMNQKVQSGDRARMIHSELSAPYTRDEDAHYWVYQVAS